MTRRISAPTAASSCRLALVALLALGGCSLFTDVPLTTAWVEIDPAVVRTIQRRTADGWSDREVTTERLSELMCGPDCLMHESIGVTIHNTGEDRLAFQTSCESFEVFELERWRPVGLPCLHIAAILTIEPGERLTYFPDVRGVCAGWYRFRLDLRDAAGNELPERMRISAPFHLKPLPDRAVLEGCTEG
jgi:hypothetical protein